MDSEELGHCCKELSKFYHKDVKSEVLSIKSLHSKEYLKSVHTNSNENLTITNLYLFIKEDHTADTFANIEIAVRTFSTIMETNCSLELFFQIEKITKLIKKYNAPKKIKKFIADGNRKQFVWRYAF